MYLITLTTNILSSINCYGFIDNLYKYCNNRILLFDTRIIDK